MSNQAIKTNNDQRHVEAKIMLRLNSLPEKDEVRVLEAFAGEGVLWRDVRKRTTKQINILSIDKMDYQKVSLKGDNLKFLKGMELNKYDIIDFDAYGSPVKQLEVLKVKEYKGIVHCTFIQSIMGRISDKILLANGYTLQMISKCPTLFCKNGFDKLLNYIGLSFGVTKFFVYNHERKSYFYFLIP